MPSDNPKPPPAYRDPDLIRRALDLKLSGGLTHDEIAAELGVSAPTVSRMLEDADRLLSQPTHELRVRELALLNWMESELRREWGRSCESGSCVTITDGADGGVSETRRTEKKTGDAGLMRCILMVAQRRAAMLRLDPPKQVHHVVEEHREQVVAVLFPAILEWCQSANIPAPMIEALAERLETLAAGEPAKLPVLESEP